MSDEDNPGWFDALGEEVPEENRKLAWKKAAQMGVTSEDVGAWDGITEWVNDMANAVEDDRPKDAIMIAREALDMTGAYRVIGYVCIGPVDPDYETAWKDFIQRFGGMLDGVEKGAEQGSARAARDAEVLESVREIADEVAMAHNVEEVWELPVGYDPKEDSE